MTQPISLPRLKTESLFSVPVWRSRIPNLYQQHAQIKQDLLNSWEAGEYDRHRHGYGYQTPATIFYEENLQKFPYFNVLKQAFIQNVESILKQRGGLASAVPFEVSAVLGWILIQTNEEWVSGTWHDHYPAVISACYYLQVPETDVDTEGAIAFQRPSPQDMFVEQVQRIKPVEGDFVLFPSSLLHRPEPCPSAGGLRITLAMDAYVDWKHQRREGGGSVTDEEFQRQLAESLS
jgi:hypothetical protein